MCMESNRVNRAFEDPVLLNDDRVLQNLLSAEEKYVPPACYFNCVQTDIKPFMRKMVSEWMAEVRNRLHLPHSFVVFTLKNFFFPVESSLRMRRNGTRIKFDKETYSEICLAIFLDFFGTKCRAAHSITFQHGARAFWADLVGDVAYCGMDFLDRHCKIEGEIGTEGKCINCRTR